MNDETDKNAVIEGTRRAIILEEAKEIRKGGQDIGRWALGALLLANGGALIALLRSDYTREAVFDGSGWAFVGGFLAALLAGFFSAAYSELLANALYEELWKGTAEARDSHKSVVEVGVKHGAGPGIITAFLATTSFIAFVWGCLMISDVPASTADGDGIDTSLEERSVENLLNGS